MLEHVLKKSPFALVVKSALEEARRRGDRRLGTEHLLLGLLHDPSSAPARALGVDIEAARAALEALDRAALAAIGIDVGDHPLSILGASHKHPPLGLSALTSGARSVLDASIRATSRKTRHTAPNHLLLALLTLEQPDPAIEVMAKLGIDRPAARDRLARLEA